MKKRTKLPAVSAKDVRGLVGHIIDVMSVVLPVFVIVHQEQRAAEERLAIAHWEDDGGFVSDLRPRCLSDELRQLLGYFKQLA